MAAVASIPEEAAWFASHKSERTRKAYKNDVYYLSFSEI